MSDKYQIITRKRRIRKIITMLFWSKMNLDLELNQWRRTSISKMLLHPRIFATGLRNLLCASNYERSLTPNQIDVNLQEDIWITKKYFFRKQY